MKKIFLLIALMIGYVNVKAQPVPGQDSILNSTIDSMLYGHKRGYINDPGIVGASIGIYWQGKTYYFSYGYANREKGIKTDTATEFEIGSNTKIFTGLLLAKMASEKRIDINSTIDKFFPVNSKLKNKVKLIDLADYTSGLPTLHDSISCAELTRMDTTKDPLQLFSDKYMLGLLMRLDSLHCYGHYEYSNLGFALLGYILSHKAGMTYDELLTKEVIAPLGLKNTTCAYDTNSMWMARGYNDNSAWPYTTFNSCMAAAGILKSNAPDMLRFLVAEMDGAPGLDKAFKISQKTYYDEGGIHTAMGWHIMQRYGNNVYVMRGDTYGFSSAIAFDKAHRLGIVMLLNSFNSDVTEAAIPHIIKALIENTPEYKARFEKPVVTVNKSILRKYIGTYQIMPNLSITASLNGDDLCTQMTGQQGAKVTPVSNNLFIQKQYKVEFEFVTDKSGNCTGVIIHQNGQDIPAIKQ